MTTIVKRADKRDFFMARAAAVLALSAGSAFAADLPNQKAPAYVPPPLPMWTGFYGGLNAGGAFGGGGSIQSLGADVFDDHAMGPASYSGLPGAISATGTVNSNAGGFIGGLQLGYNWQFASLWVGGLEVDIQGVASSSGAPSFAGGAPDPAGTGTYMATIAQFHKSLDYLGTVRGRVGFLVMPTLLAYATGGLAYGGTDLTASYATNDLSGMYGPGFAGPMRSNGSVGWTVGGGAEWMFLPQWSAKVEYLYYDFGSVSTPNVIVAGADNMMMAMSPVGYVYATQVSSRFNGQIVRAGVNYHFSWGAPSPVAAKY